MTAFSDQTDEKADKPDLPWLDDLTSAQMGQLHDTVKSNDLPSSAATAVHGAPAVAAAFVAFVKNAAPQDAVTLNAQSAAALERYWAPFSAALRQQWPSQVEDKAESVGRSSPSRQTPAPSSTTSPAQPRSTPSAADPAGLLKARKKAGGEPTWAELKALGKPVAVMKHDKELFSLATPKAVNLGKQFGFSSTHVGNAEATTIANKDVVTVVLLANDADPAEVKVAVKQLTGGADVVMRTPAGEAASKEATPTKPSTSRHPGATTVQTPPPRDGMLSQEVRDRLAKHNNKIVRMVHVGDTVAIQYYVAMDFSVAGKPAGNLRDDVKHHQDLNPFTFKFKRVAERKWQEVDKNPPASRRCPAGKENLKALFKAMGAKCEFQTK